MRDQYHARSRGRPSVDGSVTDSVDRRRGAIACVRTEFSAIVGDESSFAGRYTDDRSGPRLQKVEPVSNLEALAFETRRAGCPGVEEGSLELFVCGRRRSRS